MRVNYAIVYVSDMSRSVAFYRDVLGLPLKFESPGWAEFTTEGATLALHSSDTTNSDESGSPIDPVGHCRPGIQVPDLDEFHRRMVDNDVSCIQEPQPTFGARVAQYIDPDGLVLHVGEEAHS